jgi:hypothetical protein
MLLLDHLRHWWWIGLNNRMTLEGATLDGDHHGDLLDGR